MVERAIQLEETRLTGLGDITDYTAVHERHRVFPAVFENRGHGRILDVAAGVGCADKRIHELYSAELICNDISPTCLRILKGMGLTTTSFDIDVEDVAFPFPDGHFDAVIALATIEHVISIDHFIREIHRILNENGYLYISAPNYTGLLYLKKLLLSGKTFHDPMAGPGNRYEFYAHVRYFTYRTMVEWVSSFGFALDTVYLAAPKASTSYLSMYSRSRAKALAFRYAMTLMYRLLGPRWAAEPIICFQKGRFGEARGRRTVVV